MFRLETDAGDLVLCCEHLENALPLLRSIPRASRVVSAEGVLIAWKPRHSLLPIAVLGRDAGAPREAVS